VDDQRGRPTSAEQLALNTLTLLDSGARGTLHVTDGGECTWYELAREIVRLTGARCELSPCTTEEFPRPAPRPAYSVMDLSRTEALIGPVPHWKVNVRRVLASARLLTMEGAKT
jgi:dTDP-4-dehydrorhamnose reductase